MGTNLTKTISICSRTFERTVSTLNALEEHRNSNSSHCGSLIKCLFTCCGWKHKLCGPHRSEAMKANEAWNKLKICFINAYFGIAEILRVTQVTTSWLVVLNKMHTFQHSLQWEANTSGEQDFSGQMVLPIDWGHPWEHHSPLRRPFEIIRTEGLGINFEDGPMSAVNLFTEVTDEGGLVPTILVRGSIPRLGISPNPLHLDISKHGKAIAKETKEINKCFI